MKVAYYLAPMLVLGILALILLALFAYAFRRRRPTSLQPESSITVSFDAREIVVRDHTGETRRVEWDRISKVAIRTTDDGPFSADVFWGIHTDSQDAALVFPGGATGEAELLRELQQRLPNFRNEEFMQAMGTATDAYFVLWASDLQEK